MPEKSHLRGIRTDKENEGEINAGTFQDPVRPQTSTEIANNRLTRSNIPSDGRRKHNNRRQRMVVITAK